MLVALAVAVLAVLLGLALGLAPAVSRRALGPLRTLALTAVLAVVALHLLPEALRELGGLGLVVFALGIAAPRWLSRWRGSHSHGSSAELGLELGFAGLLLHHLGDGLALGAYSLVDRAGAHLHTDVLLALVLHTVPLVAVVAAGYASARGVRVAVTRSLCLALASALGVFAARAVPAAFVDGAKAWVAASVSGLLLHGLTHDLERDLPVTRLGRGFDLAMALVGGALGWLGATLEVHAEGRAASTLEVLLPAALERAALPLAAGLLLGSALSRRKGGAFAAYADAADPARGGVLSPEAFLLTLAYFGFGFALVRDLVSLLVLPLRSPPSDAEGASELEAPTAPFVARLTQRLDRVAMWALLGALVSALVRAAVPDGALSGPLWISLVAGLAFSVSVPLHAVAAPQIAFALADRGLSLEAALLIAALAPFALRPLQVKSWVAMAVATLAATALAGRVPRAMLMVESRLAWGASAVLLGLVLLRAYQRGVRGLLAPLRQTS